MLRPGDQQPEPPGGRAAERLREFIAGRFPDGVPLPQGAEEIPPENLDAHIQPAKEKKGHKPGKKRRPRAGRGKRQAEQDKKT